MPVLPLTSSNLSNSIVFYRALTGRSAEFLSIDHVRFVYHDLQIELRESTEPSNLDTPCLLQVSSREELLAVHKRVRRFRRLFNDASCEILEDRFALTDPDGTGWLISMQDTLPKNWPTLFDGCYLAPFTT